MEAHSGAVWSVRASETLLLSASTDCALKLWDLRAPVRIPDMCHAAARALGSLLTRAPTPQTRLVHHAPRAHNDAVTGLQFDERLVVTSGFDSIVRLWELRTLTQRAALHTEPTARCTRLAYDDTRIVTGALSGKIAVLDFL